MSKEHIKDVKAMLDHMISTSIDTVSSYIPALVLRRFAIEPSLPTEPTSEHLQAAVLFADISGFTALTEKLAEQGAVGAEQLTQIINDYFSRLISLIHAHGGDVVKFAGDALVALWLTSEETNFLNSVRDEPKISPSPDELLTIVTHRAAQCGLAIQETLKNYKVSENITLSLHVSIGAGEVVALHLGGIFGRWELLVTGNPLVQVGLADKQAQPTEVLLSPQAWALLQDESTPTRNHSTGEVGGEKPNSPFWLSKGAQGELRKQGHVRLTKVNPIPLRPLVLPTLPPATESILWSCIPRAVLNRLRGGQSQWLAELRCLTVLFVNLPDLNETTPPKLAQKGMQLLQKCLYHYEGSINKLNVDDKGTTLIAALGLPPLSHEDDALRGAQAALTVQKRLSELGWECAIGVATGRVFCGAVGGLMRREYTMLGDTVNLAARLMQAATRTILCDAATYRSTFNEMRYERLPDIIVKGKVEPVPVYRPYGLKALNAPRRQATLIGREHETACLAGQLQKLKTGQSSVVIIEGEAGIGKSRLVTDLLSQIEEAVIEYLIGGGDSIEKSTPYHAWRPVFSQLLQINNWAEEAMESQHEPILSYLRELDESLLVRAPLLNTVLPWNLPENELTLHLTGQKRADNTLDFLVSLLQAVVKRKNGLVLILEDAQWLDATSWTLLQRLHQEVQPLLLVLVNRPLNEPFPESYQQLYYSSDTHILNLERLSDDDTIALVCQRLGVRHLPDLVIQLIRKKAQGHPFFSEQLASALRDSGLLQIRNGECRLTSDSKELLAFRFPDTVQGMVASRIDRLTPELQLTLKIASVIGPEFQFRLLQAIYPIEEDKPVLPKYLESLKDLDITPLKSHFPEVVYNFKHVIIQEVTYDLMLFSQRRELHRQIAQWYENTYQDELPNFYPLLAHHWNKAEVRGKALEYAEKAGQQASDRHANRDAVLFFNQALSLSQSTLSHSSKGKDKRTLKVDQRRQALWERQLGEAHTELGQLAKGRQHLGRALALLGRPLPQTRSRLLMSIIRQNLCRWVPLLCCCSSGRFMKDRDEEWRQIANAYERIAHIACYDQDALVFLHASLSLLNLARASSSSLTGLARAYANMCFAAVLIPLPRLAASYSQRAQYLIKEVEQLSFSSPSSALPLELDTEDEIQEEIDVQSVTVSSATWSSEPGEVDESDMSRYEGFSLEEREDLTWVYQLIGMYYLAIGRLKAGKLAFQQALAVAQQVEDERRREESLSYLSLLTYHQGQFQQSLQYCGEVYVIAKHRGDIQAQQWGLCGQAINYLRLGKLERANRCLKAAGSLSIDETIVTEAIWLHGLLGIMHWRQAKGNSALEQVRIATSFIARSRPTNLHCLEGYASVTEVYLRLWEASCSSNPPDSMLSPEERVTHHHYAKLARQAGQALHRYAKVFVIARPRAWLWQGLYDWLSGKPQRAYKAWRKSLSLATELNMPYEQALAYYELGQHSEPPEQAEYLNQAQALFEKLGVNSWPPT